MLRRALLMGGVASFGRPRTIDLEGWLRSAGVPGAAVVTIAQGKAEYLCGGAGVGPETIFSAASLSKQLTAYAVLDLVRRGRWDLDRPLGDYVPLTGSPEAGRVNARMALSHSTGFPNWRSEPGQALQPDPEPGKRFRYSGEGYCYLQRVMEKITGAPFARHLRERVFGPLGMRATAFNGNTPEDWTCEDCEAHLREKRQPVLPANYPINAAASLRTSAADYGRFLAAAMDVPEFGHRQVSFSGNAGKALGWGLGWGVENVAGRTFWWQWGDNPGFKNIVFVEPARREALAVFTNGDKGATVYRKVVRVTHTVKHPALAWL